MKILLIVLTVLLVGCVKTEYLTVEETVRQCKICDSAGLFYKVHKDLWGDHNVSVTCEDNVYINNGEYQYTQIKKE